MPRPWTASASTLASPHHSRGTRWFRAVPRWMEHCLIRRTAPRVRRRVRPPCRRAVCVRCRDGLCAGIAAGYWGTKPLGHRFALERKTGHWLFRHQGHWLLLLPGICGDASNVCRTRTTLGSNGFYSFTFHHCARANSYIGNEPLTSKV